MRRKLFVSLLLVAAVASLTSGAVWQPRAQETTPLPPLTAEQAVPLSQLTFDEDEDCPDLTDPNAPPNRHFCEVLARIDYLLGTLTCEEYVEAWLDCQGIPN